ncbi:MAG: hypothetical protein AABY55_04170 [Candidatus Omnitrophota bacterium]
MRTTYCKRTRFNTGKKDGGTLVESMLAIVFLLLLIIAGASFLYYGSANIIIEGNKRLAIEAANSRLEEIFYSDYTAIAPAPADDWDIHNIKKAGGNWVIDGANDEVVTIHNITVPITTTVQYVDLEGDSPQNSFDYLRVVVSVGYRVNANERVILETYVGSQK